jgi:hypothetical protein
MPQVVNMTLDSQGHQHSDSAEKAPKDDPQFSPEDLTDGREKGNWKTRYPDKQAQGEIRCEAIYLVSLLIISFVIFFLLICNIFQGLFGFSEPNSPLFIEYLGCFFSGLIGGALYDLKWLIHVVGKGEWNADRKLWRYITPITSGVLGVFVIIIIGSGLFGLFDTAIMENPILVFALAFLSGYFSDYIVGRLQDLFADVFGPGHMKGKSTNQTRFPEEH